MRSIAIATKSPVLIAEMATCRTGACWCIGACMPVRRRDAGGCFTFVTRRDGNLVRGWGRTNRRTFLEQMF